MCEVKIKSSILNLLNYAELFFCDSWRYCYTYDAIYAVTQNDDAVLS